MNTLKTLSLVLMAPLLLAACSGDEQPADQNAAPPAAETSSELAAQTPVSPQPEAETDPRIVDGLDFVTDGAGVAVFGRNIVLNVPARDDKTASLAREVALSASNLSPKSSFTVFAIEADAAASEVPGEGAYLCAVTASENLVQESTC